MQSITTRYFPCTNFKPSKMKAKCIAGELTISYDSGISTDENHTKVCALLRSKLGWTKDNKYPAMVSGTDHKGNTIWNFITSFNQIDN